MYNDLFTIGSFTIHTYGLMTAIGIITAYLSMEYRIRKNGFDHTKVFWFVIWCLIFGYAGSKILYFLTILPQIAADPSLILRSLADGWVVYGGIIGGILGAWLYCRKNKLPALRYFDIGLASVALAQGFGRIGCFFAGCCYGVETDGFCAVTFTHSDFAPNGVPLVPTQLISSALDFLLCLLLVLAYRQKKNRPGQCTALYLICYGIGRFVLEFFRGDLIRGSVGTLSTSQFISIFIVIAGLVLYILCSRKEVKTAAACIFDLDGTLLSTLESIARPTNEALKAAGLSEQPVESYKLYVGDGYRNAVKRALADAGDSGLEHFDAVYAQGKQLYDAEPDYQVEPYKSIPETVQKLKKAGIRLAVLTNKPHASAVSVVEKFFGKETFDVICGQKDGLPLKPDPACTEPVLAALGLTKEDVICYIGDSSTDMQTGKNAGFYTVGVLWGYRSEEELKENNADLIIHEPERILGVCLWESIQKSV